LIISCKLPNICTSELKYTIQYVLHRLFKYDVVFEKTDEKCIVISVDNIQKLVISADFFEKSDVYWLDKITLPTKCLLFESHELFNGEMTSIPVIYGRPDIRINDDSIHCKIDIFGTVFFLLSRYEEAISRDIELDNHNRFPATSSIAYKFGFLERPLVDEYIELLSSLMGMLWPELKRKKQYFRKFITCDVDWPFDPVRQSFKATLRSSVGDLVKRKKLLSAINRWAFFIANKLNVSIRDGYREKISWIMDENEKAGNKVSFYFITETTDEKLDSKSDFDSPQIRELFKEIHKRGHEIGLHPGYKCFNNPKYFKKSSDTLKRVLKEEGIDQITLGGRMHFLMWDSKITPKLWDDNGFDYDSTLSFADKSGFRCGTCHPFPMYDLMNRKALNVIQRPLINMECTIIASQYENFGYSDATLERFELFKNKSKEVNGEYVVLWHNTHFENESDEKIYTKIIN